jgi:hypothetical protein
MIKYRHKLLSNSLINLENISHQLSKDMQI